MIALAFRTVLIIGLLLAALMASGLARPPGFVISFLETAR